MPLITVSVVMYVQSIKEGVNNPTCLLISSPPSGLRSPGSVCLVPSKSATSGGDAEPRAHGECVAALWLLQFDDGWSPAPPPSSCHCSWTRAWSILPLAPLIRPDISFTSARPRFTAALASCIGPGPATKRRSSMQRQASRTCC